MIDLDNWQLVDEAPANTHTPAYHDWPTRNHPTYGRCAVEPIPAANPHATRVRFYTLSRLGPNNTHGPFWTSPAAFETQTLTRAQTAHLQYNELSGLAAPLGSSLPTAPTADTSLDDCDITILEPTPADAKALGIAKPSAVKQQSRLDTSVAMLSRGLLTEEPAQ